MSATVDALFHNRIGEYGIVIIITVVFKNETGHLAVNLTVSKYVAETFAKTVSKATEVLSVTYVDEDGLRLTYAR